MTIRDCLDMPITHISNPNRYVESNHKEEKIRISDNMIFGA